MALPPDVELKLLRQQTRRTGQRLLALQQELESANRGRRRAEQVVHVVGQIHNLSDMQTPTDEWARELVRLLLDITQADHGILIRLTETPEVLANLGGPVPKLNSRVLDLPACVSDNADETDHPLRDLCELPHRLWVRDDAGGLAVLIGMETVFSGRNAFTTSDEQLLRPALRVFSDLLARRSHADELEAARARAESADRAKGQFLANMCHEIRTPMNGVLGMAESLLDRPLEPSVRQDVEIIQRSGEGLLTVLNDILDFSKIHAGQLNLQSSVVDLRRLVQEVESLFRPRAVVRGLALSTDIAGTVPPWVQVDATRLRQILTNLVSNGIKFTDAGRVSVRTDVVTEGEQDFLRFQVVDTGMGISQEDREKIFEPFVQADRRTDRARAGTGLGLSICARLAGLLGGRLELESAVGQGSVFTLFVPLAVGTPASKAEAADGSVDLPRLRVLVAEDDAVNRLVTLRILRKAGHDPAFAEDGEAALERLREDVFDLVLMDIQMPRLDGISATRAIRSGAARAQDAEIPVIALTAHALATHRAECLEAGMDGHVSKPVRQRDLKREMARVLAARKEQ